MQNTLETAGPKDEVSHLEPPQGGFDIQIYRAIPRRIPDSLSPEEIHQLLDPIKLPETYLSTISEEAREASLEFAATDCVRGILPDGFVSPTSYKYNAEGSLSVVRDEDSGEVIFKIDKGICSVLDASVDPFLAQITAKVGEDMRASGESDLAVAEVIIATTNIIHNGSEYADQNVLWAARDSVKEFLSTNESAVLIPVGVAAVRGMGVCTDRALFAKRLLDVAGVRSELRRVRAKEAPGHVFLFIYDEDGNVYYADPSDAMDPTLSPKKYAVYHQEHNVKYIDSMELKAGGLSPGDPMIAINGEFTYIRVPDPESGEIKEYLFRVSEA